MHRVPTRQAAGRKVELLGDYLGQQAAVRSDSIAVVDGARRSTYGEVDALANRLSRLLREHGLRSGDRVCIATPKTTTALVAMHAALRAGGIYVPLDLASPAARLNLILESSRPRILLASEPATDLIRELGEGGTISEQTILGSLDSEPVEVEEPTCRFTLADAEAFPETPLAPTSRPEDPAYILFTSGSTGVPKGVAITHANVKAFADWATRQFGMTHSDRNSSHPPFHFDLSTLDIYGTFAVGAELHLVPAELNQLPTRLASFIEEAELTQWVSVPSLLTYMARFDVVPPAAFSSLRRVLCCGEVLPTTTLIYWMQRVPQATFTNLYGPTEATVASSYYTVPAIPSGEDEPVPIGVACEGEELLVLDDELKPVRDCEAGMLYIGGAGVGLGYWEDEEKTRAAFVPDPRDPTGTRRLYRTGDLGRVDESGIAHFVGRADTQIKSRGHRIELGEIETALGALPKISECAVVAVESAALDGLEIFCAYAPATGVEVTPSQLKADLLKVLPRYMIPTGWRSFEELPKNVNGKVDRAGLRELFAAEN